jgi:hypothetical protein
MMSPAIWKAVSMALKAYNKGFDIEAGYQAIKYLDNASYDQACKEYESTLQLKGITW